MASNTLLKVQNSDATISYVQTFGTTVAGAAVNAAAQVLTDGDGRIVAPQSKASYTTVAGGLAGFTPAATPRDLAIITGSPNKTIRIVDVIVCGTATAATLVDVHLLRRSQQNTGGTFVAGTVVKNDGNDPTHTATVGFYTANPTTDGALIGSMGRRKVLLPIASTVSDGADKTLLSSMAQSLLDKPITLRGVNDVLAVNFNGAALPAGAASWYVQILWTEESDVV